MWKLDPALERSSTFIKRLSLCEVRLNHNALFPWVVLIPMREGIVELYDMTSDERILLIEETSRVAECLEHIIHPTKINVGALGNVVRQFHMHVVGRFENDPLWPKGMWGTDLYTEYGETEKEILIQRLDEALE